MICIYVSQLILSITTARFGTVLNAWWQQLHGAHQIK